MKAKEVLKLLGVSRVTLCTYVRKGYIKTILLPSGYYDYDSQSVYTFLGKNNRKNFIYARVSTYKQKHDLSRQIKLLTRYCNSNDINIEHTYSDISSGISLDRPEFSQLLDLVFDNKVDTIYITYTDRLTRLSFSLIKNIFKKFNTKIVAVCQKSQTDSNYNELFDDITSLMHYFSTKKYSNRKNNENN